MKHMYMHIREEDLSWHHVHLFDLKTVHTCTWPVNADKNKACLMAFRQLYNILHTDCKLNYEIRYGHQEGELPLSNVVAQELNHAKHAIATNVSDWRPLWSLHYLGHLKISGGLVLGVSLGQGKAFSAGELRKWVNYNSHMLKGEMECVVDWNTYKY